MPVTPPASPASSSAVATIGALVAVLAVVAVAGVLNAGKLLSGASAQAAGAEEPRAHRVAEDVPTSFGFVAVEHAEVLKGLTPRELGGATHGIGSFVGRDQALVQAAVTITNTGDHPLAYSPRQFRMVTRSRRGEVEHVPLSHASVRQGELQPDAAIDARLSFVVPRDGSRLEVEFLDPGRAEPIRILLGDRAGRLSAADRKALAEGHDHSEEGR